MKLTELEYVQYQSMFMELDRKTIKALSADTRVDILKSLQKRRKMPTELSKELGLAVSTISEHLKNLEEVGLIEKKHTGHKWIYYQLTGKGSNIVRPQYPVNVLLTLGIGLIFLVGGFAYYLTPLEYSFSSQNSMAPMAALEKSFDSSSLSSDIKVEKIELNKSLISIVFALAGIILVVLGSIKIKRSRKLKFNKIIL